jgi:hypothetical protein
LDYTFGGVGYHDTDPYVLIGRDEIGIRLFPPRDKRLLIEKWLLGHIEWANAVIRRGKKGGS